jgi:glyoxylase-like metal-dependent hydrolase (beta-lactamase superfamily II)
MTSGDYYVTMYKGNDLNEIPMRVHLWLENMTRLELGNYSLRIFHTPGHTSGCISIIETPCGLLFSADSVFAGGTLSYIAESEASATIWIRSRGCALSGSARFIPATAGFPRLRWKTSNKRLLMRREFSISRSLPPGRSFSKSPGPTTPRLGRRKILLPRDLSQTI